MKKTRLTFELPKNLRARFDAICKFYGLTASRLLQMITEEAVKDLETYKVKDLTELQQKLKE